MSTSDQKRALGARVHARARISWEIRCSQPFRATMEELLAFGTVEAVVKSKKSIREQVSVDVAWKVGDTTQRKIMKVINVRARRWPPGAQEIDATMDEQDEREVSEIADHAEHDGADRQRLKLRGRRENWMWGSSR
jgi:hypothetical protein